MSNWQSYDPQSPFRDDPVILADLQAPRRRFRFPLIIIGGACVMILLCGGIGAYCTIWFLTGHSRVAVAPVQSTEQKIAESTAAYASHDVGVDADVLADIERLFQRVSTAVRRSNNQEFQRLIDVDCMFARVQATGLVDDFNFVDQITFKNGMLELTEVDLDWRHCKVVRVLPVAGIPDNLVVYTYCRSDADEPTEYRWWLVNRNDAWRIYDWERLDLALSESRGWAVSARYQNDYRLDSYLRCVESIISSAEHVERGDYEAAEQCLRQAANSTAPPELEDLRLVVLGYNWRTIGDIREALRCFEAVSDPRATPGAYYGRGTCYRDLGKDRKSLEFITLYEQVVGPTPDVSREKADLLSFLGRDEEAVQEWRKLANMNPDDMSSMRSFGLALPDEKKADLLPLLKRTADPAVAAAELARSFSSYGDRAALRVTLSLIEELQPGSPDAAGVAGLLAVVEREYERAVSCFQTSFSRAADDAGESDYLYDYLDVMLTLGRFRAACEEAPDLDVAFSYLFDQYDEGDSELADDEFLELIEIRRGQCPDDPWVHYHAASVFSEKSENEAAERELREGLEKAEEDADKSSLRSFLATVLFHQGRMLEAYETLDADEERFRQLANLCRWNERPDQLRELIAAHRRSHPDSPWFDYYQAWLHETAGEMDEAVALYQRSLDEIGSDDYMVRPAWLSACVKADRWEEAYRESESPEDGFTEIAGRLSRGEKWEAVESLLAIHSAACPEDPALLDWEVSVLWRSRDYQGLIERFTPPPQEMLWELTNGEQSEIWEKVVRSHLRLGQTEHAKALAEQLFDENEHVLPLVLVHAASGDRAATQRWFEQWARSNSWYMDLYQDEDVGHLLIGDAYRPMRKRYPITPPDTLGETVAVLLLDQPIHVESSQLRDMARELIGPEAEAVVLDSSAEEIRLVIRSGSTAIWGVMRKGRLPNEEDWRDSISSESLQERVDGHQAWLAVGRAHWREDEAPDSQLVLRVADRLAGEHGVAVYLYEELRLLDWDDTARHALAEPEPLGRLGELGETVSRYFFEEENSADRDQRRAFGKKLFDVGISYAAERPVSQVDVRFRPSVGPFHEPLWIRVKRVEDDGDSFRFIGPLLESSSLLPVLSAGEFVELYEFEVAALRYRDGGGAVLVERWPGAGK